MSNCVRPEKTFDIEAIRAAVKQKLMLPETEEIRTDDEVIDAAIHETLATVARQNRW